MTKLFTIGYEGATIDQLVRTLRYLEIRVLADVRELPLSRKKGFSKTALAARLAEAGIEYIHFRSLGDPKPGRDAAKSGDYQTFRSIFSEHMDKPDTQRALRDLLEVASSRRTCMLCFERCATHCHRSIIADAADSVGFDVFNLVADHPEKYQDNGIEIPRYRSGQSLSAAE